ncbi:UNVERIFIED_CONTAM: protein TRM32 [Sesamum latifolium]|uniref:Protein TRM32 n=1 Tax=Sesamum latifolium TaxID=2727402 RepID=A0AAW2YFU6_9LAMI
MRLSPRGTVKNNVGGVFKKKKQQSSKSKKAKFGEPTIISSSSEDKVKSRSSNFSIPQRDDEKCSSGTESFHQDTIVPEVNGDLQKGYTRELDNEENVAEFLKTSPCFKPDLCGEDQILSSPTVSPSRSPVSREVQDSDSVIDKMERPSPVSVLEPLFTDDDISPASSVSQPVQNEIEPRHIHFEEQSSSVNDQGICLRISLEDEESAFEYVEAVLLGSGLNWDEFLLRWLSLDEILDSSLFDEVELFSSRPRHDQKLLFDSANEALKEEIWRLVEMHLSQCQQPHSLDQLVKRDLARSGKWLNLQSDIELIGLEIEETIFNELVDTVLDFADDA